MATMNKQWLLASRPSGEASAGNFRLVETALPALQDGRCWCATISSRSTPTCAGA